MGDYETPRTPRGPVPPWAVTQAPDVDKTSTGITPPRTLAPSRSTPPGIPEERVVTVAPSLAATLGDAFVQDMFKAVRGNESPKLNLLLQRAYGTSLTLMGSGALGSTPLATERTEKVDDVVAWFLSKARESSSSGTLTGETLLSAASSEGHMEVLQILLEARADPFVLDSHGCLALHRAAEGGSLMSVLLILDRMQAASRSISVATLTNAEGETPEMFAALAGATSVCRALEMFSDMQEDAQSRQLGDITVLPILDLVADARSPEGLISSAVLQGTLSSSLVCNYFRRAPEDEAELQQLVRKACNGIHAAEAILLGTAWDPATFSLQPALQRFAATVELRCSWQKLRADAVIASGRAESLKDFWQTHLAADALTGTLAQDRGDSFHILLTLLWVYTREAWLHHILDALAAVLHALDMPQGQAGSPSYSGAEGTTGATPLRPLDLPSALHSAAPLVDALAPCMQLVQAALLYFDEKGVRHTGTTYRPLFLPTTELRRLVDRYSAARVQSKDSEKEDTLHAGAWIALGAGTFFCSMSSRQEAARRLAETRSNVLLAIRPDEVAPCFPKHLVLKGSSVDDVLFPLGALFRVTRITRTVSSEVDPECSRGSCARWPVVVIEVVAADRFLEAAEILERRGELRNGKLEARLYDWVEGVAPDQRHKRYLAAGELLVRCSNMTNGVGSDRLECAAVCMDRAAAAAEAAGDAAGAARALLARAKCTSPNERPMRVAADAKKALNLLTVSCGEGHVDVKSARAAWAELGVRQV